MWFRWGWYFFLFWVSALPVVVDRGARVNPFPFEGSAPRDSAEAQSRTQKFRFALLASLDLMVKTHRALRSEMGGFSRSFGHVPSALDFLPLYYAIEISRATRDDLTVSARAEKRALEGDLEALAEDRVTLNQHFRVRANFRQPIPPKSYLHELAQVSMARLQLAIENPSHEIEDPELLDGVFRGYFRYEVRKVSVPDEVTGLPYEKNQLLAVGLKPPVVGEILEFRPGGDLFGWVRAYFRAEFLRPRAEFYLHALRLSQRASLLVQGKYRDEIEELASISPVLGHVLGGSGGPGSGGVTLEDLRLDPNFGFTAEVSSRAPGAGGARIDLSINAMGQLLEVAPAESLVGELEQARRRIANVGESKGFRPEALSPMDQEQTRKPRTRELRIDPVEQDEVLQKVHRHDRH
jgi:hypothetical protein